MDIGRNSPCPCGSGKKYKQCCEQKDLAAKSSQRDSEATLRRLLKQAREAMEARQWPVAEKACREAVAKAPQSVEAWTQFGHLAAHRGNPQAALELFGRARGLSGAPLAEIDLHRGSALRKLGRMAEAEAMLRPLAETAGAQQLPALLQLAIIWQLSGQHDAAISAYETVIRSQPGNAEALNNLGMLRQQLDHLDAAESCFRKALAAMPASPQIMANLAAVVLAKGDASSAEALLRKALKIQELPLIHHNLGLALLESARALEAEQHLRRALELAPQDLHVQRSLVSALMQQGRIEDALAVMRELLARNPADPVVRSNYLFALQYQPGLEAGEVLSAHRAYGDSVESAGCVWQDDGRSRDPARRLRIGYVSGDFRDHAMRYFLQPLLANHDTAQVEIFAYYANGRDDDVTRALQGFVQHWRRVWGLDDAALAAQVRADGIDILVDLSGHTAQNRLTAFALRPAPVQVTWLGYPGSSGLSATMDYRLTDRQLDPEDIASACYTEKVWYLPRWAVFQPAGESPDASALPALTNGRVTLACLNHLNKLNHEVLAVWARILRDLPDAILLIGNAGAGEDRERLLQQFAAAGIDTGQVQLVPKLSLADYLALHHQIDLALDPFPYNGGLTTYHALWMGVPVVTMAGATTVSRQGRSILGGIGLDAFIAGSADEYVAKVVDWCRRLPELAEVRASLRERMLPATDGRVQARAVEAAFREMWGRWCAEGSAEGRP